MRCGLYGKLPAKRDFIAIGATREFLDVWEPWLQGGVSASRLALGADWQASYLRAPIWRFWLGAELCGATIAGAFMPSVDGVGRYFPLTAFASAEAGTAIPPPEIDRQEAWFEGIESLLLSALEEGVDFAALTAALDAADPPSTRMPESAVPGAVRVADGTAVAPATAKALPQVFAALRAQDARAFAAATFWWTAGGDGFAPLAVVGTRMPHPHLFTGMLTGRFDAVQPA